MTNLTDLVKRSAVRSLVPMALNALPQLLSGLEAHIASVPLAPGEEYAAFVLHRAPGGSLRLTLCAFTPDNRVTRPLRSYTPQQLTELLSKAEL